MIFTTPTGRYHLSPLYTFRRADGVTGQCLLANDDVARAIAAGGEQNTVSAVNEMTEETVWIAKEGEAT